MRLSDLSVDEIRNYFSARVDASQFRGDSVKQVVSCPFHQDRKPSLSLDLSKGVWNCFAGCGKGGLMDFEMKFSACAPERALANIFELCGVEYTPKLSTEEPEAVYSYVDATGRLVFQKLRFAGKKFTQRKPKAEGGWEYSLGKVSKPLYNLDKVISANHIVVTEGEKDADRVNSLNLDRLDPSGNTRLIATTNFDGAGKWRDSDSKFFAGKRVVILPDNDEIGRRHAAAVAASVQPYAFSVSVVALPGLPEKGDVSDYLDQHSSSSLVDEMNRAVPWKPPEGRLLVTASEFAARSSLEIEWLIEHVIQRGANGFIVASPKRGKSWLTLDAAICIALGVPWLGFSVPQQSRVAIISREDVPALTKWRLHNLLASRGKTVDDLGEWMWVNSKDQSPQFKLDNAEHLAEMVQELKRVQPAIVFLDVLNVLHGAEENDQGDMRKILDYTDHIHNECGCAVGIVHHFNKDLQGRLTERMRGSSAIAGFAEWVIGLDFASMQGEDRLRKMEFELKAGTPPEPIYFLIESVEGAIGTVISRADPPTPSGKKKTVKSVN